MLTAVLVHRAAGRLDAALDICLQLLAIVPGDPHVHLAIANLQLDHGWTALATEKIELLLRLTALTGDTQAEADVHGLAVGAPARRAGASLGRPLTARSLRRHAGHRRARLSVAERSRTVVGPNARGTLPDDAAAPRIDPGPGPARHRSWTSGSRRS